jgi:uncharacterized membrane protein
MNEDYPIAVKKIVDDYLARVRGHLSGIPDVDRQELVMEINSHIYESFTGETEGDEVDRILRVLRKLGEPAEVIQDRLPGAMVTMGRKKKLPFYILSGVLIILFGLPLGIGGLACVLGLLVALGGLLIAYYAAAVSLVVGGGLGILASLVRIFNPEFLDRIYELYDVQIMSGGPIPPEYMGVVGLIGSIVFTAAGLAMLWLGKRMLRGLRFAGNLVLSKIQGYWSRRRQGNGFVKEKAEETSAETETGPA